MRSFQRHLPWGVAGVFFVLYFFTRSDWATGASIDTISKITGWSWSPQTNNPILYLLTYPIRWLPNSLQIDALNILAAIGGALTLGQLSRSICLLPHDRTRDQRQRERSDYSILSLKTNWMPPIFACLLCGFQQSFWEDATALTGDILSLFLFSYLIRCLLEFRLGQQDKWLYRLALIYGFALPCDWAFIGYLPLFLIALIWMRGARIFQEPLIFIMLGMSIFGLMSYLLLPAIVSFQNPDMGSFSQLLRYQFEVQARSLLQVPISIMIQLSLTSLLPILIMGIRFPSSIGEVSVVGTMLSNFMIRSMHLLFLGACIWVAFDPPFSPRNVASGSSLRLLTFYYLGAIAVGYFTGYALLVFGKPASQRRGMRENRFPNNVIFAVLWIIVIVVPPLLLFRNLPEIRLTNGKRLADFGELLVKHLPDESAFIISDDSFSSLLVRATFDRLGIKRNYTMVEVSALKVFAYEQELRRKLLTNYPNLLSEDLPSEDDSSQIMLPSRINLITLLKILASISEASSIYYLNSSFGLYFEVFHPKQLGLVTELIPYEEGQIGPPPIPEDLIEVNQQFWNEVSKKMRGFENIKMDNRASEIIRPWISREQNVWAVSMQKMGRLADAKKGFERALIWNPNNICARVNLRQNEVLEKGSMNEKIGLTSIETSEIQQSYGTYEQLLSANGPIDEKGFRLLLAAEFAKGELPNYRQSMLNYRRAIQLGKRDFETKLKLANSYMLAGFPNELLSEIEQIRSQHSQLDAESQTEMIRLEALGHYAVGNQAEAKGDLEKKSESFNLAETLLKNAIENDPINESLLETLSQVYLHTERKKEALELIDRHLEINPDDPRLLQNKALAHMLLEEYQEAISFFSKVLMSDPENRYALLNRAISYYREGDHQKAEIDYRVLLEIGVIHPSIYFGLGKIAEANGEATEAIQHFEQYLELAPKQTDEYQEITEALSNLKSSL